MVLLSEMKKDFLILDKPMVLHADGEYCADVTRVEFRCLEKKLWLLHEQKGD